MDNKQITIETFTTVLDAEGNVLFHGSQEEYIQWITKPINQ